MYHLCPIVFHCASHPFSDLNFMAKSHKDIKDITMSKPYLSIGEVAEKFDVSTDLLRKWERDFPQYLKPRRTQGESRLYARKDVQQVAVIYRLLRIEGLSIEGAKRKLRGGDLSADEGRQEVIARLQELRKGLLDIIAEIDAAQALRPRVRIGEKIIF